MTWTPPKGKTNGKTNALKSQLKTTKHISVSRVLIRKHAEAKSQPSRDAIVRRLISCCRLFRMSSDQLLSQHIWVCPLLGCLQRLCSSLWFPVKTTKTTRDRQKRTDPYACAWTPYGRRFGPISTSLRVNRGKAVLEAMPSMNMARKDIGA